MVPAPLAGAGNAAWVRDTAMTGAPASARAVAIPRPRPRLAPTTIVVLSDKALMIVLFLVVAVVGGRAGVVGADLTLVGAAEAGHWAQRPSPVPTGIVVQAADMVGMPEAAAPPDPDREVALPHQGPKIRIGATTP
jgi:hypothetical protein